MIKQYLNQPYPFHVSRWKLIVSISLFIGLFMLVFQPFGLSRAADSTRTWLCLGYGFVTLIALTLNLMLVQRVFKNWFDYRRWTVLKQIGWLTWIIFSIGLGNFIYTSVVTSYWSLVGLAYFQFFTLAVGLIPIILLTVVNQNRLLAQNLKSAQEFNSNLHTSNETPENERVTLVAENEKDSFEVDLSNLLYIESSGNYVEIYYMEENRLKNVLLRSTLKRTETQLEHLPSVIKCHRAYLVNATKIIQVKGNSQGLRLALKDTETEIPVSRNLSKSLKEKLNALL